MSYAYKETPGRLRWIERDSYTLDGEHFTMPHKERVLQQLWSREPIVWTPGETPPAEAFTAEWRDVPLERLVA